MTRFKIIFLATKTSKLNLRLCRCPESAGESPAVFQLSLSLSPQATPFENSLSLVNLQVTENLFPIAHFSFAVCPSVCLCFRRVLRRCLRAWRQLPGLQRQEREKELRRERLSKKVAEVLPNFYSYLPSAEAVGEGDEPESDSSDACV